MARRSLRPQLNQIRTWVQQGRTDAWIAHQLEATVQQIDAFKKENELVPADAADSPNGAAVAFDDDEIDLRAQDDELVAAELEKAEEERLAREAEEAETAAAEAAEKAEARAAEAARRAEAGEEPDDAGDEEKPRRRGRRGGRGRTRRGAAPETLEGTFDHGAEGYGLWLDPAVADDPVYAEHWAGHRPVVVSIDEDQIVIRRAGDGDGAVED